MLRKKEIYREKLKFDHFRSSLIAYRLHAVHLKHTTVAACRVLTRRYRKCFEKRLNCTVLQGHTIFYRVAQNKTPPVQKNVHNSAIVNNFIVKFTEKLRHFLSKFLPNFVEIIGATTMGTGGDRSPQLLRPWDHRWVGPSQLLGPVRLCNVHIIGGKWIHSDRTACPFAANYTV